MTKLDKLAEDLAADPLSQDVVRKLTDGIASGLPSPYSQLLDGALVNDIKKWLPRSEESTASAKLNELANRLAVARDLVERSVAMTKSNYRKQHGSVVQPLHDDIVRFQEENR